MTVNRDYCGHLGHSRPPTPEEFADDCTQREAAIERAIKEGSVTKEQVERARKVLDTFTGYRRCTLNGSTDDRHTSQDVN